MSYSELDKVKDFYNRVTGKKMKLKTHWTSRDHINIRIWMLWYRDYEERMTDDIGNKFIVIKHKM
jgi:hypothetical protein